MLIDKINQHNASLMLSCPTWRVQCFSRYGICDVSTGLFIYKVLVVHESSVLLLSLTERWDIISKKSFHFCEEII
jgi:hypothetical protein